MKFDSIIKSHPLVLVDFYADWCGPCKAMAPIFDEIKKHYKDKIKIVKIDTEINHKLSAAKGIRSIPTIQFYKYGKMQWQQAGVLQLTMLKSKINPFI